MNHRLFRESSPTKRTPATVPSTGRIVGLLQVTAKLARQVRIDHLPIGKCSQCVQTKARGINSQKQIARHRMKYKNNTTKYYFIFTKKYP
jgi:hypothetical protein